MTDYTCDLDHNRWQLYDIKGVKAIAAKLSRNLTKLVRDAKQRRKREPKLSKHKLAEDIRDEMAKHLNEASKFGASDTEPHCVLVAEIERALGLDRFSLDRW